jgi:hypothetical protein
MACDRHAAEQIRIVLVAGLRLRGARTAEERLYPYPLRERFDMPAADLAPLGTASQHPRTGEREIEVQLVETPRDCEVRGRHRTRQIIDAAAADPQSLRLPRDRQIVLTVDHRLRSALPPW